MQFLKPVITAFRAEVELGSLLRELPDLSEPCIWQGRYRSRHKVLQENMQKHATSFKTCPFRLQLSLLLHVQVT